MSCFTSAGIETVDAALAFRSLTSVSVNKSVVGELLDNVDADLHSKEAVVGICCSMSQRCAIASPFVKF